MICLMSLLRHSFREPNLLANSKRELATFAILEDQLLATIMAAGRTCVELLKQSVEHFRAVLVTIFFLNTA